MAYAKLSIILLGAWLVSAGCSLEPNNKHTQQRMKSIAADVTAVASPSSVVWAINVGGPEHTGIDGIQYHADVDVISGELGSLSEILGTQDPVPFQTYRNGDISAAVDLPNGAYSVTLKFAEPEDIPIGARLITADMEDQRRITELDIRRSRDNNIHAALVKTISNVIVDDGTLNITLGAQNRGAVLNAIVVQREQLSTEDWELVWQDEFDVSGPPDPNYWSADIWPARKVNGEDQAYTARRKNARVEDGRLILEAHRDQYNGAQYTSGRVHTKGKVDFLYGRASIRAKLAAGQGTWSALWMLPSDPYRHSTTCKPNEDWQGSISCDAWPNSGEIDIMEHVGYDIGTVHATVHTRAYYFINQQQRKAAIDVIDVTTEYHEYTVEWSPERIDVFLDDIRYFSYMNDGTGWRSWPFDHPFHLVLNLAIGGDWGRAGGPIDNSVFPARMEIDYVRLFKRRSQVESP